MFLCVPFSISPLCMISNWVTGRSTFNHDTIIISGSYIPSGLVVQSLLTDYTSRIYECCGTDPFKTTSGKTYFMINFTHC